MNNFIQKTIHKRERIHLKKEPYPHPNKKIKYLDDLCLILAVIQPLSAIPQISKIYIEKQVAGISITMWILYTIALIPFMTYGIVHKVKPMIIVNLLWISANITIIIGILLYS